MCNFALILLHPLFWCHLYVLRIRSERNTYKDAGTPPDTVLNLHRIKKYTMCVISATPRHC
ncbi:hypothetical protein KC19_VG197600 [Ceratodon purpureus]|uniref:Secreted protein n=1 Tax=Ceratodon purpureus TaxID=3225 RepID=A0A8T0HS36_CERPU|nr:hypothetical protein KC19_VG197600 [Ceratodon purpureus]